jgi:hypothetical protein
MTVLDQLNLCQDYSHISPSLCRLVSTHTPGVLHTTGRMTNIHLHACCTHVQRCVTRRFSCVALISARHLTPRSKSLVITLWVEI